MEEEISSAGVVWLMAGDPAGLTALGPARETLEAFGVGWGQGIITAAGALTPLPDGVRAVIVASADASLPGAFAAATDRPVVRVPVTGNGGTNLALLHDPATADLPAAEAAFATVAIGEAGAKNAALFIVSVLALADPRLWAEWTAFRQRQTDAVLASAPLSMD